MNTIVKLFYQKDSGKLNIKSSDRSFDVSRIKDLSIEQWAFPFYAEGVKWNGLYEELKAFTGSDNFSLQVDSDDSSFEILKYAMENNSVELVKLERPTVTIIYSEDPFTTRITVDGVEFDTTRIFGRSIEEWVCPIDIRGIQWNGIFTELENYTHSNAYVIYFVGKQRFMDILISKCPASVSVFYRDPQVIRISRQANASETKQVSPNNRLKTATQLFSNGEATASAVNDDSVGTDQIIKNYQKQLQDLQQEEFQPSASEEVKNPFYKLSRMQIVVLVVGIIIVVVFGILSGNTSDPFWLPTVRGFIFCFAWLLAIEWLLFYIITLIYYVNDKHPRFQRYFKQYAPFVAAFIMFYCGFGAFMNYSIGRFYYPSYLFFIVFTALAVCLIFWMVLLYKKRDYLNKMLFLVFKSYKPKVDDDEFQKWQAEQDAKIKDVADKLRNVYDNLNNKGK